MTATVQVFGRRHDWAIHVLMRPATKKAPRHEIAVGGAVRCRERYGDLAAAADLMNLEWMGLGACFAGAYGD